MNKFSLFTVKLNSLIYSDLTWDEYVKYPVVSTLCVG